MSHRMVGIVSAVMVTMVLSGCAGSVAATSAAASAAIPPPHELSGTWTGSYGQVAASLYADEGTFVLRIAEDGSFTATVAPSHGANNRAKRDTWSGTVVTRGSHVILQASQSRWPWVILARSGDDTLYGVANDPAIEADVMIEIDRDVSSRPR